jgi:hypothetical protein
MPQTIKTFEAGTSVTGGPPSARGAGLPELRRLPGGGESGHRSRGPGRAQLDGMVLLPLLLLLQGAWAGFVVPVTSRPLQYYHPLFYNPILPPSRRQSPGRSVYVGSSPTLRYLLQCGHLARKPPVLSTYDIYTVRTPL